MVKRMIQYLTKTELDEMLQITKRFYETDEEVPLVELKFLNRRMDNLMDTAKKRYHSIKAVIKGLYNLTIDELTEEEEDQLIQVIAEIEELDVLTKKRILNQLFENK